VHQARYHEDARGHQPRGDEPSGKDAAMTTWRRT
jgi:hypothetical protein